MTLAVGQIIEVVRVDNSDAYNGTVPAGSFRIASDYKGIGADVLAPGTWNGLLFFSYTKRVVDNANCTKIGRLRITKVK